MQIYVETFERTYHEDILQLPKININSYVFTESFPGKNRRNHVKGQKYEYKS